jgi:hypothetical protein
MKVGAQQLQQRTSSLTHSLTLTILALTLEHVVCKCVQKRSEERKDVVEVS